MCKQHGERPSSQKNTIDGVEMSNNLKIHYLILIVILLECMAYKEISPKCTSAGICGEAEQCNTALMI